MVRVAISRAVGLIQKGLLLAGLSKTQRCAAFALNARCKGLAMRESILDLILAIVLGLAFAVLALAYFDVLFY